MARFQYSGNAPQLHLLAGINSTDLSFVADATATAYPDGSVGSFVVYLDRTGVLPEKVKCSSRSGVNFTIAAGGRGYDGTIAADHAAGVTIDHTIDAASMTDFARHVYNTASDDHTQYLSLARLKTTVLPRCKVTKSAWSAITSGAESVATWDTEVYDTDTMHSTVSNTNRITATTAGLYIVTGYVNWATANTGTRGLRIALSGVTVAEDWRPSNSVVDRHVISIPVLMIAGDYVELYVSQDSGVSKTPNATSFFAATMVSA